MITVLHPDGLECPEDYYAFYRDHGITQVSFSVDELEGANKSTSFAGKDFKAAITAFMLAMLEQAYRDSFPLHIREVERIAQRLAGVELSGNEQVEPWAAIVVAANGSVSTFSPEFMEMNAPEYDDFVFGNILDGALTAFAATEVFERCARDVAAGVAACRSTCRYFDVCGGGSPVNKFSERGDLRTTETDFCRLTTQTSADALLAFVASRGMAKPSSRRAGFEQRMSFGLQVI